MSWTEWRKALPPKCSNERRNTIDLWLKRQAETGDYQAKPNRPPGNGHKITDWAKFREFAKTHGDAFGDKKII